MTFPRALLTVLLPFAAGYYASYLLRTINALAASRLVAEFGLDAAALGLLTGLYFLAFAAMQLPLGVLLDRMGPRRVQLRLLPLMAAGALIFALADGLPALLLGRVLIGIGAAGALMAGLTALAQWVPPGRLALANGLLVMIGALGAVSATAPAELIFDTLGWRALFALVAAAVLATMVLVLLVVPGDPLASPARSGPGHQALMAGLSEVWRHPGFLRLAPLSACCIGTAFALHGLWAAPWLIDVAGLPRPALVWTLTEMALALSAGALGLGVLADRLGRVGVRPDTLLAWVAAAAILAQAALAVDGKGIAPAAPLLWILLAAVGSATVLSYAALAAHFPKGQLGRANAALNLLHIGTAFIVQAGIGGVVALWTMDAAGRYPPDAYAVGFGLNLVPQVAALAWFWLVSGPRTSRPPAGNEADQQATENKSEWPKPKFAATGR